MATLATYEYVLARLGYLKWGLYDAESAINVYRLAIDDAIQGPVTPSLESEATGWNAKLDSAEWAVDVYWEGWIRDKIAELEAAEAAAAAAAAPGTVS